MSDTYYNSENNTAEVTFVKAGLYMRLSKDDGCGTNESASITNQRKLLICYCRTHGITEFREYTDDGYSGTDFRRPAFMQMLKDSESGLIDTVIVKDLSRLGRDYLITGKYIEDVFPAKNIRFISLSDGYDSKESQDEMLPFRNLINEMYARDISKKIRASLAGKMADGEYIGAHVPYGYRRSVSDRHKLEISPEHAETVRAVFEYALQGMSAKNICRILNQRKIPSPLGHMWGASTVLKMLHNKVYCGTLEQGKTKRPGAKSRVRVPVPEDLRYICENAHEGIVSVDDFRTVQSILTSKNIHRNVKNNKIRID